MSVAAVFPDADTSNTGALTGGASAHAVLGDINDSTYVTYDDGEKSVMTFANPSLPAGAKVKKMEVVVRATSASGAPVARTILTNANVASGPGANDQRYGFSSTGGLVTQWTAARIDGNEDPNSAAVSIGMDGGTGQLKVTTVFLLITYVVKPVVDVTAPSGTLTQDNRPTVEWTNTYEAEGGPQFAATVKIFTAAQYGAGGFDPSTSTPYAEVSFFGTETSWRPDDILPNGTYRAYVQTTQFDFVNTYVTDWDFLGFVINVSLPATPSLTVTPEADADPVSRVSIALSANSGAATTNGFEIQREQDGEWIAVRTLLADGLIEGGTSITIYDFEAPNGETLNYRARALHHYTSTDAFSGWATDDCEIDGGWCLKHPFDPSLSTRISIRSFQGHGREPRVAIKQPLNRPDAVPVGNTPGPQTGSITFAISDDEQLEALEAVVFSTPVLLLQAEDGDHEPDRWVVLGTETIDRAIDKSWIDERDGAYSWTEVARPDGEVLAWPED